MGGRYRQGRGTFKLAPKSCRHWGHVLWKYAMLGMGRKVRGTPLRGRGERMFFADKE